MNKTAVSLEVSGSHATLTFVSENGINVVTPGVLRSFGESIARIRSNHDIRDTVVTAEGKVFLAGADIKEMAAYGANQARDYGTLGQDVLAELEGLPCLTVAVINGAALGGGLELALACDFRIAVKHARLGLPETTLGLIPGWGGIPRLSKLIGPARAKRMYLSGNQVSAEDALAYGLVDEVVNTVEDLSMRVPAFLRTFRRASPAAIALAKRASRDFDDLNAFVDTFKTKDSHEGMRAFVEKRPAEWME